MWDDLQRMLTGPGHLRFVVQPLLAILFGLRDAKADLAAGRPPFVLSLFRSKSRKAMACQALEQIAIPLAIAVGLDLTFQYVILQRAYLWSALIVGAFLIALPYSLARGLGNRAFRRMRARHA
ncbi:MAG: hypothetical protein WBV82_16360 [Myxococcaceae bacterium]